MGSNNILHKIIISIEHYNLLNKNKNNKVILALSGGPDSMFLLNVLFKLKENFSIEIIPVHINHMIREGSYEESVWLKKYVKDRFGLDLLLFSSNVLTLAEKWKKGIEETGRIVRQKILKHVFGKYKADFIATGHNLDDQVETVLFRMIRGTGIKGILSMNPKDGIIIRPLLFIKKSEILDELKRDNLQSINDISNADMKYTRNLIRHSLLPMMEKININAKKHIFDLVVDLSEIHKYIEETVNGLIKKYLLFDWENFHVYDSKFLNENKYIVLELIKKMFGRISGTDLFIERKHINDFYTNALKKGSYSCFFPKKIYVSKSCDKVIFSKKKDVFQNFCISVDNTSNIVLPNNLGVIEIHFKEKELEKHFQIRSFLPGDRYKGKKLKEYFLEKRIPTFFRKAIPLVAIGSNVIHNFLFDGEKKEVIYQDNLVSFIFHPSELYCKIKHFLV